VKFCDNTDLKDHLQRGVLKKMVGTVPSVTDGNSLQTQTQHTFSLPSCWCCSDTTHSNVRNFNPPK